MLLKSRKVQKLTSALYDLFSLKIDNDTNQIDYCNTFRESIQNGEQDTMIGEVSLLKDAFLFHFPVTYLIMNQETMQCLHKELFSKNTHIFI
jgi:hypothetical protein